MQKDQERHAIVTCYDRRLHPILQDLEQEILQEGHIVLDSDRPVGGIHAMTMGHCRTFFYDQLDGLVQIAQATHIHIFPHTDCEFNKLKQWQKIGQSHEHDLAYQIKTLKRVREGAAKHLRSVFPNQAIGLDARIIITPERRIVTLEEALDLLPSSLHHLHHCEEHRGGVCAC